MIKKILFLFLFLSYSAVAVELICKSETRWGHLTGYNYIDELRVCFDGCDDSDNEFSITIKDDTISDIAYGVFYETKPTDIKFTNSEVQFILPGKISYNNTKNYIDISIDRISGRFHAQEWRPHLKPYDIGIRWAGKCKPGKKLF